MSPDRPDRPDDASRPTACPDCGAPMAADQRYCLGCGHRRGEPRLPFMDAATVMESLDAPGGARRTPPPPPVRSYSPMRWNPNVALLAGVAVLMLAVGVGFLGGRAALENGPSGGHVTETITIKNEGEAPTTPPQGGSEGQSPEGNAKPGGHKGHESPEGTAPGKQPSADAGTSQQQEEAEKEAERRTKEVIHYSGDGKLANPKATLGESCEEGTPGCGKDHKFHGVFFE